MSTIEQLTKERDEAREWVARLQKTSQTLTCVYCGQEYPPGSPTHGAAVLTEHIRVCVKHPMRAVERERDNLRATLLSISRAPAFDANTQSVVDLARRALTKLPADKTPAAG